MTAHEALICDLKELLAEAEAFQYHDFKNKKFSAPKNALVAQLNFIKSKAINGEYDNNVNDEAEVEETVSDESTEEVTEEIINSNETETQ